MALGHYVAKYHYSLAGKLELLKNKQTRFGTEATWRSKPNLKNEKGQQVICCFNFIKKITA